MIGERLTAIDILRTSLVVHWRRRALIELRLRVFTIRFLHNHFIQRSRRKFDYNFLVS